MKKLLLLLPAIFFSLVSFSQEKTFYKEKFRPAFHFTPAIHWMNDPNGLVYYDGEYHLFYQFNPFGNKWGHMSWGHATSKDLVHWQHLPLAIAEEKDTMIFSGSCVVDKNNSSGFAKLPGQIPLVAIYTAHIEEKNQLQHIAYSLDNGKAWTKYNANPVLDLGLKDFRDPKVFWYESGKKWVMAVVLPIEKKVQVYTSVNLKKWELMSSFGPAGDITGIWECPDLFEVPIEDQPGKKKWVLMHSPAPYMQYFVGEFNGTAFRNENPPDKIFRPDYGPDYYAAVVYNNIPPGHSPISIGWINNWKYAVNIPTTPWKSAMSLPRELSVKKINNEWILIQQPARELLKLRGKGVTLKNQIVEFTKKLPFSSQTMEMEFVLIPAINSISGIRLAKDNNHYVEIGYDANRKTLYIDRSKSGDNDFDSAFKKLSWYETSLLPEDGKILLHLFYDKSILEVFANKGEAVMTAQLFPPENSKGIEFFSNGKNVLIESLHYWPLNSIW